MGGLEDAAALQYVFWISAVSSVKRLRPLVEGKGSVLNIEQQIFVVLINSLEKRVLWKPMVFLGGGGSSGGNPQKDI